MKKNILSSAVPIVFTMLVLSACGRRDDTAADSLNRNLDLANKSSSGQVSLDDRPSGGRTTGGSKTTSGGTTRSGGSTSSRTGSIAEGTTIALASSAKVCTHTHKPGQTFTAVTTEAVSGSNGAMIPAGAVAVVEITSLKRPEKASERGEMGFRVKSISVNGKDYPLDSRITAIQAVQERSSRSKDAQKVVGGAVVGAIIGQIIGKDTKGTVIGAATGAAAGTVVAMATSEYEGCVPDKGNITIALNAPLVITVADE